MRKKSTITFCLGFQILMMLLICGCSSTMATPQAEEKLMTAKDQGTSAESSAGAGGSGVGMRVLWKVSDYKMGPAPVWGEKEARAMLFKPLDMTETAIIFDGKSCRNVTFKKETRKAKDYFASAFQTTPQALAIAEDVVEVITTNCDLPGFGEYLRLKDSRLVIYLNGVFFYFKPNVNY